MTDEEQKKIFSRNLNRYIKLSGKMQKEIATELGYSPTTFNTWCVGKIIPSAGKIQRIADYFHIGKSDLIDDKSETDSSLPRIMQYYEKLNDFGKKEATKRVEELTYFPQYTSTTLLNAAHAYENASEEDKTHDEDIMNDDNLWS